MVKRTVEFIMKNFYFDDYRGRNYLTLKRACRNWVNADCPDIKYRDGSFVLRHSINGWEFNGYDVVTVKQIARFIDISDKAFTKKYHIGVSTSLLDSFKKDIEV